MLSKHLPWVLLVTALVVTGGALLFKRSERIQLAVYSLLHRLPISRTLVVSFGMAYMTEHLSILVRAVWTRCRACAFWVVQPRIGTTVPA